MASSTLSAAQRAAARKKSEIASDYAISKGRLNADNKTTQAAIGRALQNNLVETRGDYAGRGLYNSSIRTGEESELASNAAIEGGAATEALRREIENLGRAQTKGLLGINTGMESGLFQSTGESLSSILARALNDAKARNRPM